MKNKEVVYIAGPITGIPDYKEKFARAEKALTEAGYIVINPAYLPNDLGDTDLYMTICYPMIDAADVVFFLEGWEKSAGANREMKYSQDHKKMIIFEGSRKGVETKILENNEKLQMCIERIDREVADNPSLMQMAQFWRNGMNNAKKIFLEEMGVSE